VEYFERRRDNVKRAADELPYALESIGAMSDGWISDDGISRWIPASVI